MGLSNRKSGKTPNGSNVVPTPVKTQLFVPRSTKGFEGSNDDALFNSKKRKDLRKKVGRNDEAETDRLPKRNLKEEFKLVTLTKDGYYTDPSIEDLNKMPEDQLKSVSNFTIGHRSYGKVKFLDPVNIVGINFDNIVIFEDGQLEIYPDNTEKPGVGYGINTRAQISLYNCKPRKRKRDKNKSREQILDQFENSLRKKTERFETPGKFISYKRDTGCWTFQVEHFSKYGLQESSESDSESESTDSHLSEAILQTSEETTMDETNSSFSEESSDPIEFSNDYYSSDEESSMETYETDDISDIPSKSPEYAQDYKQEIRSHLFSPLHNEQQVPYGWGDSPAQGYISSMQEDLGTPPKKQKLERPPFFRGLSPSVSPDAGKDNIEEEFVIKQPRIDLPKEVKEITLKESIVKDNLDSQFDKGLNMGRSFRASWGPGGKLIHPGKLIIKENKKENSDESYLFQTATKQNPMNNVTIRCIRNDEMSRENIYTPLLQAHLSNYDDVEQTLSSYIEKLIKLLDENTDGINDAFRSLNVFEFVKALWGDVETSGIDIENAGYFIENFRRKKLDECLTRIVRGIELEQSSEFKDNILQHHQPLDTIFRLLAEKKVIEARDYALNNKLYRLAAIVSQSTSLNSEFKQFIEYEIDIRRTKNISDKKLIDIFMLVCGDIRSISEKINTWLQCLAWHVWYRHPPSDSLSDLIRTFLEENQDSLPFGSTKKDTIYQLLCLYCNVNHPVHLTLSPTTYSESLLDYSLSWHLYSVLRELPSTHFSGTVIPSSSIDYDVTINYAHQLEALGLWEWSVYVLQNLPFSECRDKACRYFIDRNIEDMIQTNEKKRFLLERMPQSIPSSWISEAESQYYKYKRNILKEIHCLKEAEQWNKAHDLIVKELGKKFVLEEKTILDAEVNDFFKDFNEIIPTTITSNFQLGKLYYDYFVVQHIFKSGNIHDKPEVENTMKGVLSGLSNIENKDAHVSIMVDKLTTQLSKLMKNTDEMNLESEYDPITSLEHDNLKYRKENIKYFPLPDDKRIAQINTYNNSFLVFCNS
eukprot:TRINITY_DN1399_c0_g1_i11.p1 TRINITY_DN1399_c0_g1~~TRINITY_DN1399_c0_g1_i11.p1  ORF type:complete len:1043 (+),score=259.01 TRINITY_DN1399_c0_g1_i11:1942-5070(+)